MLEGVRIKPLKRKFDERGFFLELMRKDWKELFKEDDIAQANLSISYYGYTKLKGEEFIKKHSQKWCTTRASVIYGWGQTQKLTKKHRAMILRL